ncbi:MAG TPA: hypothetical protein VFG72_06295 [Marmoricola sp.]|nr:hypothetical protein [Marmoricola sp.]
MLAAVAALVAVLLIVGWVQRGQESDSSTDGPETTSTEASANASASSSGSSRDDIRLTADRLTVTALEAVPLKGSAPEVEPGTALRVQLHYARRGWVSFPLPTVVNESGGFETFVELGRRGMNRLRAVDPSSGAKSNVVVVEVR